MGLANLTGEIVMPKVSIIMPAHIRSEAESGWMSEAIDSVLAQTVTDWELVIADDRSEHWPTIPDDKRIHVYGSADKMDADAVGISATRNRAAALAESDLLLPLDADDKLAPFALDKFLGAWTGSGFVYSSVMMFGLDWTRRYTAPEYSFYTLLKNVFCVVGSLHLKSDWAKVKGWKSALDVGFEDWEYWIAFGELGICGTPIPDVCYWYRRTANGRLQHLLKDRQEYQIAYHKMRDMHLDVFNGRFPVGCCGGKRSTPLPNQPRGGMGAGADYTPPGDIVLVQYVGRRSGSFGVRGNRSGIRYTVPGISQLVKQPNGSVGVSAVDLPFFMALGRGADFRVYMPPKVDKPVQPQARDMAAAWSKPDEQQAGVVNESGGPIEPEPSKPQPIAAMAQTSSGGPSHMAGIEPARKRGRPRRPAAKTQVQGRDT